jgi:thioredoxin 1
MIGTNMNDSLPPSQASTDNESLQNRKRFPNFWRCFWLTTLVVSLAYAWYSFYVPTNDIAWAEDYTSASLRAADSGKPLILSFTGTWCVPCRIMKRQVWADKEVAAVVNAKFIPVSIDVDSPENAEVMARYEVTGPPVTLLTDPQGNVLDWRTGGISKSEFFELIGSSAESDS